MEAGTAAGVPDAANAMNALETPGAPSAPPQNGSARASDRAANQYRVDIRKAMRERQYEKVLDIYAEMLERNLEPDTLMLNYLVDAKGRIDGIAQARDMLNLLVSQHSGLEPTAQTYAALVRSCEQPGDVATARSLYQEAIDKNLPMHQELFNALISVCTQAKEYDIAESFFKEMKERGVRPSSATYLKYIYACLKQQQPDKAYEMLCEMESEWRVPDKDDYKRLMSQFKAYRHNEGKMRCVKALMLDFNAAGARGKTDGLDRDVISGLFKEAQEARRPDDVVELGAVLRQAGARLDRFQTVGLINAHVQLAQPMNAFTECLELFEKGHELPQRFYEEVVDALGKEPTTVDESYYLLESRKQEGKAVPLGAVNMVIDACAILNDLDRAFATWAELEQFGLSANAGTYNALLHTCLRSREVGSGRRLLARMTQDGIEADADTYMYRCLLLVMGREFRKAEEVLRECKDAGLVPPGKMYVTLFNSALRGGRLEVAREILASMEADGHRVSKALHQKMKDAEAAQ